MVLEVWFFGIRVIWSSGYRPCEWGCERLQINSLPLPPGGSDCKASAYNVGDPCSIPGSERSPGEGNGNPLQYSCLENPMNGGAWWATDHGVAKSRTRLSDFTFTFHYPQCEVTMRRLSMNQEKIPYVGDTELGCHDLQLFSLQNWEMNLYCS